MVLTSMPIPYFFLHSSVSNRFFAIIIISFRLEPFSIEFIENIILVLPECCKKK